MPTRKKASSKLVAILDHNDGAAGQVSEWFERATGLKIACFVNDADAFNLDIAEQHRKRICQRTEFPQNGKFKGRPFIVSTDWMAELRRRGINKVLPMGGSGRTRLKHVEMCRANGFELVSAIHPSARIMAKATIEPGVWIDPNVHIGYKTEIQAGVIIETGSIIEHHNIVESGVEIDPGVVTGGFTTMRRCSTIHLGARIINRIEIGEDAIIGAGAVVITDIPPRCTAVGVPAKVIKRH